MLYPVCPTCQLLLADKQLVFETEFAKITNDSKLSEDKKKKLVEELLNKLGLIRYCCRMRMISYVDQVKIII
jgi:DNA-directed RNA polymerase subunit N (RpoN/RPB10)